MQTDQELVARLRGSDPSPALAELIRRHGRMVERTVRRCVADEHLTQDVCQAVFWVLLQKAGRLGREGSIGGWLHRTAILTARNAQRVEARRRRHEEEAGRMTQKPGSCPAPEWPEGFDEALARLPDPYREAIVLRYLEGRSRSEIGRSLALSETAVDMRLSRGLERLRKAVAVGAPGLTAAALTGILTAESSAVAGAGPLAAASLQALVTAEIGGRVLAIAKGAMKAMFWMKMKAVTAAACAAAVLTAGGVPFLLGQDPAPKKEDRRLSTAEFEKLHRMLKPQPGESRWMEIAWYPNVWEARQKAAAEGKPLFLWAGSGGAPSAGC